MAILKIVAAGIAPFVVIFLGCAFVEMSIDPHDWSKEARGLCVMICVVFGPIMAAFAASLDTGGF